MVNRWHEQLTLLTNTSRSLHRVRSFYELTKCYPHPLTNLTTPKVHYVVSKPLYKRPCTVHSVPQCSQSEAVVQWRDRGAWHQRLVGWHDIT